MTDDAETFGESWDCRAKKRNATHVLRSNIWQRRKLQRNRMAVEGQKRKHCEVRCTGRKLKQVDRFSGPLFRAKAKQQSSSLRTKKEISKGQITISCIETRLGHQRGGRRRQRNTEMLHVRTLRRFSAPTRRTHRDSVAAFACALAICFPQFFLPTLGVLAGNVNPTSEYFAPSAALDDGVSPTPLWEQHFEDDDLVSTKDPCKARKLQTFDFVKSMLFFSQRPHCVEGAHVAVGFQLGRPTGWADCDFYNSFPWRVCVLRFHHQTKRLS